MNKQHEIDCFFMRQAEAWASRSKCLSRKIGSILVKDNHVIATGFNGVPKGVPHCCDRDDSGKYSIHTYLGWGNTYKTSTKFVSNICPRQRMGFKSGEGLFHCYSCHSEINPILQCARFGVATEGSTLYAYCSIPCLNCCKEIINAGIKRIVCLGLEEYDTSCSVTSNELLTLGKVQLDIIAKEEIERNSK